MINKLHHKIINELLAMVQPLIYLADSEDYRVAFFYNLGWNIDELNGIPATVFDEPFHKVKDKIESFQKFVELIDKEEPSTFFNAIVHTSNIFEVIRKFKDVAAQFNKYLSKEQQEELQDDITLFLIAKYIADYHPVVFSVFRLYQIIEFKKGEETVVSKNDKIIKYPYEFPFFNKDHFSNLFESPKKFFEETYGLSGEWETQEQVKAVTDTLFPMLSQLVHALNGQSIYGVNPRHDIHFGSVGDKIIANHLYAFWELSHNISIGTTLALSPKEYGNLGWVFSPFGKFFTSKAIGRWTFSSSLKEDIGLITIQNGKLNSHSGDTHIELQLQRKSIAGDEKWTIGNEEKTHLEIGSHEQSLRLYNTQSKINVETTLALNDIKLKLDPEDADSFIASLMNKSDIEGDFDLLFGWSNVDGFFLGGGAHLDMTTQVNKDYKYLQVHQIRTQIYFFGDEVIETEENPVRGFSKVRGRVGLSFTAQMGIIKAYVEGLGPSLLTGIQNGSIVASGANIAAPEMIGISIDTETVFGLGFIKRNEDLHQYDGMITLSFQDLELSSFAIVDTRLPNNEKGFAMLITMSAEFPAPIALPFGFTLEGIGGLIAINRTINSEVLRGKIGTGLYDNILFPSTPFHSAHEILSELRASFPVREGHDIIAPFLKLSWFRFIYGEIGVLIEKPSRGRVIVLGHMYLNLPSKSKKWVDIKMDVWGDFNLGADYILIEGRLYDSHFFKFDLYGGFAFMMDWGQQPQFLLSVGGYHPRYIKPNRFPDIPRAGIAISSGKNVNLSCEFYNALTTNSYQVGAQVDLNIHFGKLRIQAYFGFDVLLQINPIYFDFAIRMGVALRWGSKKLAGVDLAFNLSGPRPWNVKGKARIKILFIKIKIRFNHTWGSRQQLPREYILAKVLLDQLTSQLETNESWNAQLPTNFKASERLAKPTGDQLLIHPSAILEIKQNVVPLHRAIQKSGTSFVEGRPVYRIDSIQVGSKGKIIPIGKNTQPLKAYFSRGQFEELSEAQQLSTKDFELMNTGFRVEDLSEVNFSNQWDTANSAYENIILREDLSSIPQEGEELLDWIENKPLYRGASQNSITDLLNDLSDVEEQPTFDDSDYYIVSKENFKTIPKNQPASPMVFDTQSQAKEYLETQLKEEQEYWQVMPIESYELQLV